MNVIDLIRFNVVFTLIFGHWVTMILRNEKLVNK